MPFSPYLALAAVLALLGSFVSGALFQHSHDKAAYEAVHNAERAAAATVQAEAEKRAREAQERVETANRTIEETHAKAIADAAATRDDFTRRLRDATRSRRCNSLPAGPANNPSSSDVATRGNPGSDGVDIDAGTRLRDAALILQAYVKTCHAWAMENGR
jgi:membrane protein involved in colicin uptake